MKYIYNKLVRDNIPQQILDEGKVCAYSVLTQEEYVEALETKLLEETNEYLQQPSIEELADILEVLYCVAQSRGWSLDSLEVARVHKESKNGAFDKHYYLKSVED